MKRLVTAKEIETLAGSGQKVCYIDKDTIVTPAAKDAANGANIEFSMEAPPAEETPAEAPAPAAEPVKAEAPAAEAPAAPASKPAAPAAAFSDSEGELDVNTVYRVLKLLMEKGLLNGLAEASNAEKKKYSCVRDENGLKVVRGDTIQYDFLETDSPSNQVYHQEVINADDGCKMNAGMITIEKCKFGWRTDRQELYYVVEGSLIVTVGDRVYTANPGDTVFFPEGVQVTFGSSDKMKAFYAAY